MAKMEVVVEKKWQWTRWVGIVVGEVVGGGWDAVGVCGGEVVGGGGGSSGASSGLVRLTWRR